MVLIMGVSPVHRKAASQILVAMAVTLAVILLFISQASAAKKVTPTELPGGKVVSAEKVKALIGKGNVYIFDMRKAINYGKGHVPGAIANPYKWIKKTEDPAKRTGDFNKSKLPADKNATLVFYSDGPTGWKSYFAAKWAVDNGYKKVLYMREGSAGWFDKNFQME